ncbi:MAG TPA: hypothetical protein VK501_06525 [Baekduia sp.]|uniref:hypothetical protein n=1 Tax=Baekduia sp. TaxID=2600305 RepID=UPI002BE27EA6|nr:hypothetical protein [Baekduia sp.]HMJ33553.1 hypothetical protein [Baekduia sp.]
MSASAPVRPRLPSTAALRTGLAAVALAGAVCLLVATFTTVIRITVGTTSGAAVPTGSDTGWDRHGPALIVLALLAVGLLGVGLRGSRVALAGVAATGLAVMAIAMASDRPDVHATGAVGDVYAEAMADPGAGYYLETLGGALLLATGGGLLALGRMRAAAAG